VARQRVKFTFVEELIKEPIIWKLAKEFDVVTNIRRADVTDERGWVILELDGDKDEIERSLEWVRENGVRVDPVYEDIVEG
jgi:ABC-type methionine transport system ATPase subunit